MEWYGIIGLIAALCIAIYNIPQLVLVLRKKNTSHLSIWMLSLLVAGDFCFMLNGIGTLASGNISGGLPVLLANIVSVLIAGFLLAFKIRNRHYAKKFQVTENQFCENFKAYSAKIKMLKSDKISAKKVKEPDDPSQAIIG